DLVINRGGQNPLPRVLQAATDVGLAVEPAGLGLHGEEAELDQFLECEVEGVGIGVEVLAFLQEAALHRVTAHVLDVDRAPVDARRAPGALGARTALLRPATQAAGAEEKPDGETARRAGRRKEPPVAPAQTHGHHRLLLKDWRTSRKEVALTP